MKVSSSFVILTAASCKAFNPSAINRHDRLSCPSSTARSMGMFDFFSAEAKEARALQKQKEVEEQEKLQKAIMERRNNPDKMEEYEARIQIRRQLRNQGNDAAAESMDMYQGAEKQTLLDGTNGIE